MSKRITCWYCNISGSNILDKSGCCNRCGTNIKKWPKRNKLAYPKINDTKIAREVLGTREKCVIPAGGETEISQPFMIPPPRERKPGKVNHCGICWQKTLVFIWSTSRNIDQERLKKIMQEAPRHMAYPICWACIGEHNLIVGTKKEEKNEQ